MPFPRTRHSAVAYRDMKVLGERRGAEIMNSPPPSGTPGVYEARMVASMVDDPSQVTPAQMDRWCEDFDNWGICDTVCF